MKASIRPELPVHAAQGGFTLIEVMITVAILGIIAAIALPSYQSYVVKSRRADAKSALMQAANRQEQFILNRSTYTNDMTLLGYPANPARSPDGFYSISAAACAAVAIQRCYVLTATPVGPQANDTRCGSLTLASTGARGATGTNPGECW